MSKPTETVFLNDDQFDELIKNVENKNLSEEDWKLLRIILKAYRYVLGVLRYKKTTVQKLKDMLFGKHTEKQKAADNPAPPPSPGDPGPPAVEAREEVNQETALSLAGASPQLLAALQEANLPESDEIDRPEPKNKRRGHGRRGHHSWENAEFFFHRHGTLKVGDPCPRPRCSGRLYHYAVPGVWVQYVGQAPIVPEVHKLERLRCSACTEVFTATPPEDLRKNPPPPIQVCDASDMNTTLGEHQTFVGGCHDHARRKFFEIKTSFPSSCAYALKEWKQVYHTDKIAKQRNLTPQERLLLHQTQSQPALERLKTWCENKLKDKEVEPAGHLGGAIQYYLNHYETLTLFLRKPGVPIANIDCERALKTPIAVRKMSYFYKNATGAKVSDIIFSFIATCRAAGINVFDYFVTVQDHHEAVERAPELWLPWNYQEQLVKA